MSDIRRRLVNPRLKARAASVPLDQSRYAVRLSFVQIGLGVLAALCLIQAAIGGDVLIIACCLAAIGAGAVPIKLFGIQSTIGVFFALLIFFYPFNPLLLKTFLLQPIQSNLFVSELSFFVMTIGVISASAAAVVIYFCKALLKAKPLFSPLTPAALELLCVTTIVIGVLGILGRSLPGGFGRVAALTGGMIYLSLVASIQLALMRSQGRRSFSPLSICLLALCVVLALASGSKQGVFAVAVCYFMTVYFYRGRFERKEILFALLGVVFLLVVAAPAINIARGERDTISSMELISRIFAAMVELWSGNSEILKELSDYDFRETAYYSRYLSDSVNPFDRFVFVVYIDSLLRFVNDTFMGYADLLGHVKESVIPNLLDPGQKEGGSGGDRALQFFGIYGDDETAQITLPVFADGYLAGGLAGVAIVTFAAYLFLAASMVFVFGAVPGNAFAIWWLALNGFVVTSAGASGIAFGIFRVLPVYVGIYLFAQRFSRR